MLDKAKPNFCSTSQDALARVFFSLLCTVNEQKLIHPGSLRYPEAEFSFLLSSLLRFLYDSGDICERSDLSVVLQDSLEHCGEFSGVSNTVVILIERTRPGMQAYCHQPAVFMVTKNYISSNQALSID